MSRRNPTIFELKLGALALPALLALQLGCEIIDPPVNVNCPDSVPSWPFGDPIWHPSGQVIGFNYWPAREIITFGAPCYGARVNLEPPDSAGFWLINPDGTNLRRIFPDLLEFPTWSPSGNWIAFVRDRQIYKMSFIGESFDTSSIVQLTLAGWNTLPVWSPDGEWIAWHPLLENSDSLAGIWIMRSDGTEKQSLRGGSVPSWHPTGTHILGTVPMPDNTWRFVRYYPFTMMNPETLSVILESDGILLKYSPDGAKVAFWPGQLGGFQLLVMDSDGTNPKFVTNVDMLNNEFIPFDWHSSSSKIIFSRVQLDESDKSGASLGLIDLNSEEETLIKRLKPNQ